MNLFKTPSLIYLKDSTENHNTGRHFNIPRISPWHGALFSRWSVLDQVPTATVRCWQEDKDIIIPRGPFYSLKSPYSSVSLLRAALFGSFGGKSWFRTCMHCRTCCLSQLFMLNGNIKSASNLSSHLVLEYLDIISSFNIRVVCGICLILN